MARSRRRERRRLLAGREGHQGERKSDTGQRTRPRERSQARKWVRGRKQGAVANAGERWKAKNFFNGSDHTVVMVIVNSRLPFNAIGRTPWTPPPHRLSLANALACASCTDGFTGVDRADTCVRKLEAVAEVRGLREGWPSCSPWSRPVMTADGAKALRCSLRCSLPDGNRGRKTVDVAARRSVGPGPILG